MKAARYSGDMARQKVTLSLDAGLALRVDVAAKRQGLSRSALAERAFARYLGIESQKRVWERNADLSEDDAMELALEAQRAVRRQRRP